jgi:hypothetical protein
MKDLLRIETGGDRLRIGSVQPLVDDTTRWQTLIADDVFWQLAYTPSLGHPAQLTGRAEAVRHATWFVGAVENFRFFDLTMYALADPQGAIAEVKGEGLTLMAAPRSPSHAAFDPGHRSEIRAILTLG